MNDKQNCNFIFAPFCQVHGTTPRDGLLKSQVFMNFIQVNGANQTKPPVYCSKFNVRQSKIMENHCLVFTKDIQCVVCYFVLCSNIFILFSTKAYDRSFSGIRDQFALFLFYFRIKNTMDCDTANKNDPSQHLEL